MLNLESLSMFRYLRYYIVLGFFIERKDLFLSINNFGFAIWLGVEG